MLKKIFLCREAQILGIKTTRSRLMLGVLICSYFMILLFFLFSSRYQIYIPRLQKQCLVWNVGVLDKWQKTVNINDIYAFKSKNMVIYPDGEVIAKKFVAKYNDLVEINDKEEVLVNHKIVAKGLPLATKLGMKSSDFMGKKILGRKEYFTIGTTKDSFDSRYWGSVYENQILGKLYVIF